MFRHHAAGDKIVPRRACISGGALRQAIGHRSQASTIMPVVIRNGISVWCQVHRAHRSAALQRHHLPVARHAVGEPHAGAFGRGRDDEVRTPRHSGPRIFFKRIANEIRGPYSALGSSLRQRPSTASHVAHDPALHIICKGRHEGPPLANDPADVGSGRTHIASFRVSRAMNDTLVLPTSAMPSTSAPPGK